ncbi:hypothetical protein SAMN04488511_12512 [Pedobacter suwonensis]|uniref:DUF1684 domain-containing protein n=1 Tax=Pedobacter suwonensis TaxID=332999 RepID=A0A1I0U8G2_9SPHI|nr:DUF1684 domain-containing protein [Pedobacter suwonensis]SFA60097.1 hypothetical protein SAMN04488511_12512 [Pedobacter suwonensis]
MKIFTFLLLLISMNSFAQSYAEQIAKHREAYMQDFIKDERAPLKKSDLQNLHFYDADSTYKIFATIALLKNEKVFKMPAFNGSSSDYYRYAHVNFVLDEKKIQMTLYRSVALSNNPLYKDHLFLPFTDETNNKETYGGGRYIDLDAKEIVDNHIEIDFNKAYNPYCAFSEGYRCPVPPEENDLQLAIKAGEKLYTGKKKHQK